MAVGDADLLGGQPLLQLLPRVEVFVRMSHPGYSTPVAMVFGV